MLKPACLLACLPAWPAQAELEMVTLEQLLPRDHLLRLLDVGDELKLTQISFGQRFKTDTPTLQVLILRGVAVLEGGPQAQPPESKVVP